MMAGGWEWSLYQWQENNDERYDLKTANPCTSDFANALLEADERFFKYIVDVPITPTRVSGTGSTLSTVAGAINQQDAVCPSFTQWLMSCPRVGKWHCADAVNCLAQHACKGGRECDAALCHLLHQIEESRWVDIGNKSSRWAQAMSLDECLHYSAEGKICELSCDFTCADVWRASVKAVAYGRREIVAEASEVDESESEDKAE